MNRKNVFRRLYSSFGGAMTSCTGYSGCSPPSNGGYWSTTRYM